MGAKSKYKKFLHAQASKMRERKKIIKDQCFVSHGMEQRKRTESPAHLKNLEPVPVLQKTTSANIMTFMTDGKIIENCEFLQSQYESDIHEISNDNAMTPKWNDNADPQNLQQEIILPSTTVTQLDSDIIAPSIGQIQSNNHTYYVLITNDQANTLNVPATGQTVCPTEPTSSQAYQIKTDVDKPETGEQSSSISQYEVKEETNSFDDFAEYVREQLKILSEEDALSAQEEIKKVLERYKIKQEPKDPLPEYENKLFVFKYEPESEEDEKMDVK